MGKIGGWKLKANQLLNGLGKVKNFFLLPAYAGHAKLVFGFFFVSFRCEPVMLRLKIKEIQTA